jgi:hypothetical protein
MHISNVDEAARVGRELIERLEAEGDAALPLAHSILSAATGAALCQIACAIALRRREQCAGLLSGVLESKTNAEDRQALLEYLTTLCRDNDPAMREVERGSDENAEYAIAMLAPRVRADASRDDLLAAAARRGERFAQLAEKSLRAADAAHAEWEATR